MILSVWIFSFTHKHILLKTCSEIDCFWLNYMKLEQIEAHVLIDIFMIYHLFL